MKKLWRFVWKSVLIFFAASFLITLVFRWIPVPITPLMLIRWGQQLSEDKKMKLEKDWVALEDICPHLQLAVVCSEDQNFLKHNGVDFGALKKALNENEKNKKRGKKRFRGGSTITMQTAKNVYLWPGRDYIRKAFEFYFSFVIEICWSKERIMEVYLNVIEFGDGIYGAEAAARHYFGKSAEQLTKEESAVLATLLPNPRVYGKNLKTAYLQKRKQFVLQQMRFWGGKLDYEKYEVENVEPKKKK